MEWVAVLGGSCVGFGLGVAFALVLVYAVGRRYMGGFDSPQESAGTAAVVPEVPATSDPARRGPPLSPGGKRRRTQWD